MAAARTPLQGIAYNPWESIAADIPCPSVSWGVRFPSHWLTVAGAQLEPQMSSSAVLQKVGVLQPSNFYNFIYLFVRQISIFFLFDRYQSLYVHLCTHCMHTILILLFICTQQISLLRGFDDLEDTRQTDAETWCTANDGFPICFTENPWNCSDSYGFSGIFLGNWPANSRQRASLFVMAWGFVCLGSAFFALGTTKSAAELCLQDSRRRSSKQAWLVVLTFFPGMNKWLVD